MAGLLILSFCGTVLAASVQLPEQKIKAGLVYNFIKYTAWPEQAFPAPDAPLRICLLGGDAFNGALDPLQGRTAQMRPIHIYKIYHYRNLGRCHALFIHTSEKDNLDEIFVKTRGFPVLLISDIRQFTSKGGMVEFSNPHEQRIHLYLNQAAIYKAGLRVGDQLVKLAEER